VTTTEDVKATTDVIDLALAANDALAPEERVAPATTRRRRAPKADPNADVAPAVEPYTLKSFTTREVPWSKIGHISETALTAVDAAAQGGLDFEVELLDAGFKSSEKPLPGKSAWRVVPHRRASVRKDNQQFLAYVSSTYSPVQYSQAFAFMDEIAPRYVAAGTLGGGRQGFMVVQIPDSEKVELKIGKKADPLTRYMILRTSHDLTRAVEVSVMLLRDECMNALTLSSFTAKAEQRWAVKHVGADPMSKLAAAQTTVQRSDAYVEAFVDTANELAKIRIEMDDATALLKRILPDRPRRDDQVNAIVHGWRESPTNGFTGNGWGLVNAVSEYFEWGRNEGTRTEQSRFTGGLTGATHRYTNRTAQLLLTRRR
jgi:phage/plasmid-like protein (TIGR03299 family)